MSLFGFNKRPIYRKFDYIPRFYDPAKEELAERIKNYDGEENKSELAKAKIRSGLRTRYRVDADYQSKVKRSSNRKLFLIITLLSVISYLIVTSKMFLNYLSLYLN